MNDIFEDLDRLEPLSQELNAASNDVNEIIARVEARLKQLNLGVEAEVDLLIGQDEDFVNGKRQLTWRITTISYAKGEAGWALYTRVNFYPDNNGEPDSEHPDSLGEQTPLRFAPRELRMLALEGISELVEVLEKKAAERLARIKFAKEALKKLR